MKKAICFFATLCIMGACANNDSVSPSTEVSKTEEQIDKELAAKLAAKHIALKKWSWGEPKEVVDQGNQFWVFYNTPEKELRLIGSRVLVVEKDSGVVYIQKRR